MKWNIENQSRWLLHSICYLKVTTIVFIRCYLKGHIQGDILKKSSAKRLQLIYSDYLHLDGSQIREQPAQLSLTVTHF